MAAEYWARDVALARNPEAAVAAGEPVYTSEGVIFHLATDMQRGSWAHPAERGLASFARSSDGDLNDAGANCLAEQMPRPCYTAARPQSSYSVGLGDFSLKLTAYTLRDGSPANEQWFIREWLLQGSVNNVAWETIDERTDATIQRQFGVATFRVAKTKAFRYFRVVQTARNAASGTVLALSGLELFGRFQSTPHAVLCASALTPAPARVCVRCGRRARPVQ